MNEKEFLEIGRYLRDELDKAEKEAFENKMRSDKAFAEKVRKEREVMEAFTDTDVIEFRRMMKNIETESAVGKKRKIIRMTRLRYAAAIIILLLISLPFIYNTGESSLYDDYYVAYNAEDIRSDGDAMSDNMKKALEAYKTKNYESALKGFEDELTANPDEILARFLAGHCYLHDDDIQNALTSFNTIIEHGNSRYVHASKWYMALTYLKNQEFKKARELFVEITNGNSGYKQKAGELLQKMP